MLRVTARSQEEPLPVRCAVLAFWWSWEVQCARLWGCGDGRFLDDITVVDCPDAVLHHAEVDSVVVVGRPLDGAEDDEPGRCGEARHEACPHAPLDTMMRLD